MAACTVAAVGADRAVGPPNFARALAAVAVFVNPIRAGKWRPAFPAILRRRIRHETIEAVTAVARAPVPDEELPVVAFGAVLAVLAGTVLADLAVSDRSVGLSGALAAVINVHTDQPAALADKRSRAPAFEQPDARRRELRRARLHARGVKQVVPVSADAAGVPGGDACAVMAVVVEAAAAIASHRARLDPAASARERLSTAPVHPDPVAVA